MSWGRSVHWYLSIGLFTLGSYSVKAKTVSILGSQRNLKKQANKQTKKNPQFLISRILTWYLGGIALGLGSPVWVVPIFPYVHKWLSDPQKHTFPWITFKDKTWSHISAGWGFQMTQSYLFQDQFIENWKFSFPNGPLVHPFMDSQQPCQCHRVRYLDVKRFWMPMAIKLAVFPDFETCEAQLVNLV